MLPLMVGVLCLILDLLFSTLCPSCFAFILIGKRWLLLLWLSSSCLVAVGVLWLFLVVTWVGLQCMIVVFPGHTHSPFDIVVK